MVFRHSRSALLACAAVLLAPAAHGQNVGADSADGTVLETILVKGKSGRVKPASAADTPLSTQVTADEIAKKDVSSITDLGRVEPGIDYVRSKGGLFIRGLGGPRVTTLIDGIPVPYLSNDARSGGPTTVTNADGGGDAFDFSSLSTVDIVRGADSSRAGNGALSGALVLRTLEPQDLITEGRDWGGVAKTTYDSRDYGIGGSVAVAKTIDNTSILFQGGYKKGHEIQNNGSVDSIGATRTKANPADSDQTNLLFKLRWQLEGGHTIGFTAERFSSEKTTDLKTLQGVTTGSSRVYKTGDYWGHDDSRRERLSADYSYEAPGTVAVIDAASLSLYWQRLQRNAGSEGTRTGTVAGPWLRDNEIVESAYGATGSITADFQTGTLAHQLTFGGDVSLFSTSQYIDGNDACILGTASAIAKQYSCPSLHADQADIPEVDGKRVGLSVDDRIDFGNGFALTPGVRFDWYDYDPQASSAYSSNSGYSTVGITGGNSGSRLSPKLLATYQATPDIELFAQWSMAYRAPTVNELYLNFANPSQGYATIGNADLKAETAQGFEIGANLGDEDLGGRITAFHNRYSNFIDSQTTISAAYPYGLTSYYNRDKVQISGIEVRGRKAFDSGVNLHASLAYAYGEDSDTHEYLRSVAPLKAVVGIGYDQETWGLDLSMITSAAMRDDGDATTFDAPGYGIADLTAYWEPEQTKGLRIQAGIYNLFDKEYYNGVALKDIDPSQVPSASNSAQAMSYYSEPGRTFKISLTQSF